jgi:hypothetical protein
MLYQNVFQNPELFGTQVSLSLEQSKLDEVSHFFVSSKMYQDSHVY